jgi:hypothetical protein
MEDLFYKLKALIYVIGMTLIPILIGNALYYGMGCIIAWDTNPMNWWLLQATFGRVILVILELIILANVPNFWDELS